LENPESLNKTLSEILDGTKKPCDSLVNTHHIGAETELTNVIYFQVILFDPLKFGVH
jgi:hypothetical protein